jgi:chaperonin cofactor prefoldin
MQVAKFWRRNQLRYRLQGLAQSKAQLSAELNPVQVADKPAENISDSKAKVKVA